MELPQKPRQGARLHHGLTTLVDTAHFHAEHQPDTPAVVCGAATLTYADLHRESSRTARALRLAGLSPGDRVAYLGKESERYYEILFACAKTGTVLVPVNWRLTSPEVSHILQDSGTRLLFVEEEFRPVVDGMPSAAPEHVVALDEAEGYATWKAADTGGGEAFEATRDTPVAQLYTSGTTGLPKGVVLAHRSFFAIADAMAEADVDWIDWQAGDVALIGIPGFHIGGLWWATQNFNAGTTVVAMPAFDGTEAVELIRRLGVTTACVVPAMLRMMLTRPGVGPADFVTLRKIVYGGSPISETLLEQSLAVFRCEFAQIYGLTETGNTAVCLPPAAHEPGSSLMQAAGRPYPGVQVKVVGDHGAVLPLGAVGEVCLGTPAHMVEYWNLPDKTAETLVDGWIRTGDAGFVDEAGYVYIRDRIKDAILVAGENVYPAEIENVLERHPGVAEAVVVGAPDDRWGEYVHAFVVFEDRAGEPLRARDLHTFLTPRLAAFKLPAKYEFIDHVPRNPSGKILRRELRNRFWDGSDRKVN
ncbi:long-chain fatty acid--CoA ligase [Streptomyces albidoflavus]|uniref:long-chain-fatty-acid--CoA ligase n=1 Tax=Streptomyces albidoflavus TaxID=1886 RepID=UPI000BADF2A4|nr:long-chain-fatty-acid--CoA ligase [Streptomyces albidoflavus]MBF4132621.1 long-chain-fatty-acid--CoA ligase [Streptomyces albidoflavus]PAX86118.1 long-chain fatty acid--CoA ligase [Streptomyces albidoflavus]PAX88881.1 long-chain fatty acid--CoA ligase [Streptomyces albidoflavus]PBO16608.1 long-chain fatty acid--CoA ligase [Streptomyces albidoflavus]PBO21156.1 long-chain fatty acid--CoA ligase [Streptomyces albidoflavus]